MNNYFNAINELIKAKTIKSNIRKYQENNELVNTYWHIGKLLYEAQNGLTRAKYGDETINKWSLYFVKQYGKGYSFANMKRMRQFYIIYQIGSAMPNQLTWTHICELLPIKDANKRNFYINQVILNNLSYRKLHDQIKSNAFERLSLSDKNNIELINEHSTITMKDMLKDPIIINTPKEELREVELKAYILSELEHFFLELGTGFAFIGSEYKLNIGNKHYYIDMLLTNIKLNCYVIIKLKVRKIEPKDYGQVRIYMNYIDSIKEDYQNKSIGIIIGKEHDKYVIEYVDNDSIYTTNYKLKNHNMTN